MIVERVTDTLIMATIIVIIISGIGFIEITLRLYFVESAITLQGCETYSEWRLECS
jgi:hypothetical protein